MEICQQNPRWYLTQSPARPFDQIQYALSGLCSALGSRCWSTRDAEVLWWLARDQSRQRDLGRGIANIDTGYEHVS